MKLNATTEKVTIKWFVYSGGEKMPYESTMRGRWGYDAECFCGWATNTGGGINSYVRNEVIDHKILEHNYTYLIKAGA